MKDKKLLLWIASVVLALILLVVSCIGIKNTHVAVKEDMSMAIIFAISLLVACVSYIWTVLMSLEILDVITSKKKKQ